MTAKVIIAGDEIIAGVDIKDVLCGVSSDDELIYISEIEDSQIQTHKNSIVIQFDSEEEMETAMNTGSVEFKWNTGE